MPRKPLHIEAAAPRPEGRQVIWAAIRKLKTFCAPDLRSETAMPLDRIRDYVLALQRGKYVRRIGAEIREHREKRTVVMYELLRDVGVDAPRLRYDGSPVTQGRAREQMWRTMRVMRAFDARDLALTASTEEQPVRFLDARDYAANLAKAGYLVVVSPASNRRGLTMYQFVPSRYSGPLPPQVQRIKQVWDQNLGKAVWSARDDI